MIRVPARRASPVSIAAEASAVRHGPQDETPLRTGHNAAETGFICKRLASANFWLSV